MTGFLSSYRVIDLSDERGLLAGQMLAKLGADVIQVEPPGGSSARRVAPFDPDGRSFYWSAFAAGKRGIVLDIEDAGDREQLHGLLGTADFLIDSADPGPMRALGLDSVSLAARHPHLIRVSITAFGSGGPKSAYAASDLILWAAGGPLFPHRDAEGPPLRISAPQAWLHAAADGAAGALIAHFARLRTGLGQAVDISAQTSVTPAAMSFITSAAVGHAGYLPLRAPPARPPGPDGVKRLVGPKWRVRDGLVELTLGGGPFAARANSLFAWMRAEDALPDDLADWDWSLLPMFPPPDTPPDPRVEMARDAVADFLAGRTKADLEREAAARGLLMAPVNTTADLLVSAHLKARDYFVTVEEDGQARTLPRRFAIGPEGMFAPARPAPTLGEHQADVFGGARPARTERPSPMTAEADGAPPAPFADLRVLDLAWVVAGPALGRALADFGATVVRVDSSVRIETARLMGPFPGGQYDPQRSALYDTYNTGKLGLSLDLTKPEAQAVVRDLALWADVLVESFVPGQMARWGLSAESLRAANPGLIFVSTSLMGQTGPLATLGGYGNLGAAVAGYQAIVGRIGETPIGPYGPYTDFVGPRFGLVTLLAALDERRRTGAGCGLDISQAEAGIQFLAPLLAETAATGRVSEPQGNRDAQCAPHGVFRCRGEEQWIAIAARDDAEWGRLAALIGGEALHTRFATLAGRKADEDHLEALVETWTADRTAEAVEARLQTLGIPAHKASASADMVADPQLIARGHFVRLPHPLGGDSVFEASRFALSGTPARYRRPAPHFGRDNREVLIDLLGYDEARVAALGEAGVLR